MVSEQPVAARGLLGELGAALACFERLLGLCWFWPVLAGQDKGLGRDLSARIRNTPRFWPRLRHWVAEPGRPRPVSTRAAGVVSAGAGGRAAGAVGWKVSAELGVVLLEEGDDVLDVGAQVVAGRGGLEKKRELKTGQAERRTQTETNLSDAEGQLLQVEPVVLVAGVGGAAAARLGHRRGRSGWLLGRAGGLALLGLRLPQNRLSKQGLVVRGEW